MLQKTAPASPATASPAEPWPHPKDDVLLTIGAAGALFIIATALLEKGDELIVVRPNYATNIETPRAIGAAIKFIDLRFEEKFALDIDKIKAAITRDPIYFVTYPHNPTGVCLNTGELTATGRPGGKKELLPAGR
jgi:aspartate/methionine/tyrosine aminotransferase